MKQLRGQAQPDVPSGTRPPPHRSFLMLKQLLRMYQKIKRSSRRSSKSSPTEL
jgi:hypothetical protein